MKQGWEIKRLGEVCELKSGITISSSLERTEGDVLYVKVGDMTLPENDVEIETSSRFVNRNEIRDNLIIPNGAVIFPKRGGAIATNKKRKIIKSTIVDLNIMAIIPKEKINNDYYWFQLIDLNSISNGTTIPQINNYSFDEVFISYPKSLPEQHRIVSILDQCFSAIDKAKANAEQNLKNTKELFESYLQGVFENGKEDWEVKKMKEVFEIKPQKKEAKEKLAEVDLVTFLPMEDLGIMEKEVQPVQTRTLKEVIGSYTYFAENDVLLAKITPCFENGKIGIAKKLINGIGFGSSEYIVFRSNGYIEADFLFYFLSRESFRKEGRKNMSGAVGHKRVSKEWIENYLISFPKSKAVQQSIVRQLDALRTETQKLEAMYQKKIANLEELRKSILGKAFAGELTEKSRRDDKIIEKIKNELKPTNPEGVTLL